MEKQLRWPVWMNYAVEVRNKIDALPRAGPSAVRDYQVPNVGKQRECGRFRICTEALSKVRRSKIKPMQ